MFIYSHMEQGIDSKLPLNLVHCVVSFYVISPSFLFAVNACSAFTPLSTVTHLSHSNLWCMSHKIRDGFCSVLLLNTPLLSVHTAMNCQTYMVC